MKDNDQVNMYSMMLLATMCRKATIIQTWNSAQARACLAEDLSQIVEGSVEFIKLKVRKQVY